MHKLNLTITLFYLVILVSTVMTACSTKGSIVQDYTHTEKSPKKFRILSKDISGKKITNQQILEAIKQQTFALTNYTDLTDSTDKNAHREQGFNAIINNNIIELNYFNGTVSAMFKRLSTVKANIQIQIENKEGYTFITIYPPDEYTVSHARGSFLLSTVDLLDKEEKLIEDINNIFDNIDLNIYRIMFVSGTFIVGNDSGDVLENFEQKLGFYQQEYLQGDAAKYGVFALKHGSATIPLQLTISQLDIGTEVHYDFDVNYTIKSNGTSSFKHDDVQKLVTIIEKISVITNLDEKLNATVTQMESGLIKVTKKPEIKSYNERQNENHPVTNVIKTNITTPSDQTKKYQFK